MIASALPPAERRLWTVAGSIALGAHGLVAAALIGWHVQAPKDPPEPVMIVELPAAAAAAEAAAPSAERTLPPEATPTPPQPSPIDVPPVRTVTSSEPVVLPPPQPVKPVRIAAADPTPATAPVVPAAAAPAEAPVARTGTADAPHTDEKAKKREADYYSQLAAYLNRKKSYPADAKKARQQGVVAVRFTVARNGDVSGIAIKRSSGHDALDRATLDLLRRVAPLPSFPVDMRQATAIITVPIEYSLRTS